MNVTDFNETNYLNQSLNKSVLWDIINDQFLSSNEINESVSIALVVLYVPVFLIGILGNGSLTVIVLSRKQLRNVTNLFICNLAVADLAGEMVKVIVFWFFFFTKLHIVLKYKSIF